MPVCDVRINLVTNLFNKTEFIEIRLNKIKQIYYYYYYSRYTTPMYTLASAKRKKIGLFKS